MQDAVEHGGDGGSVAEEFAPVVERPVGGEQGAAALVAAHDDLEQVFGGGRWQLAHADVVDDEQRHGRERGHGVFAQPFEGGLGQVLDEDVRFAVDHLVALVDRGQPDGLRQVALAGAGRPVKQDVSRALTKRAVARSKTSLRSIFLLKSKS